MIGMKYYEWAFSRSSPTESLNSRVCPLLTQLHLQGCPAPEACGHCIRQQDGWRAEMAENVAREERQLEYYPGFCKISKCYQNIRILTVDRFLSGNEATERASRKVPTLVVCGGTQLPPCPPAHWWAS